MNLRTIIKLTGISFLWLNSFSAYAADSCLFESKMDFTFEPDIYEEAKKAADEIVSSLKVDNFSLSLVEHENYGTFEYRLITTCGLENAFFNESKLIVYFAFSKMVQINRNTITSLENIKGELEKAIYSISGLEPGTNQLNATMQSACYVNRKLGEMKKYHRDFKIEIETDELGNNKKIKVQENGGMTYPLFEVNAEGLIQFVNFDLKSAQEGTKFQRLNENQKAVYVSQQGKKMGFDEYRQGLFYHLIGLMENKFNLKFAGQKINSAVVDVASSLAVKEEPKALNEEPEPKAVIEGEGAENEIKAEASRDYTQAIRSFFIGFFSSSNAS